MLRFLAYLLYIIKIKKERNNIMKNTTMKNIKKIVGIAFMFIGLTALCAVDSEVPLWGTMLIMLIGIVCPFVGCTLYYENSNEPMVD